MPAYNEQDNIERAVCDAARAVRPLVRDLEIVVVDDGSRDATPDRVAAIQWREGARLAIVRHPVNRGYGAALRSGFERASGVLVFYTDSDNQFDLAELAGHLPLMRDYDAVLGYRLNRQDRRLRKLTSAFFNRLTSLVFGLSLCDINCSFKLMRRSFVERLALESTDFFVDTELVVRLHQLGARLIERGVRHYPRRAGRSTVRLGDVPRTLAAIVRMRWRLGSARAALP